MLVISRKKHEGIVINDDITLIVVEISDDKVRLGINAPKNVPVHRREVFDAIKRKEAKTGIPEPPRKVRDGDGKLVLSRKKRESIVINDNITIVVIEIRGERVRLGVEAPREIPVHRSEVFNAIKRSKTQETED